jgi:hypothetical protein
LNLKAVDSASGVGRELVAPAIFSKVLAMVRALRALAAALGIAGILAAYPAILQAQSDSTPAERPLTDAELMALPPFERSHELCKRHPNFGATLAKGNPPMTIRFLLSNHMGHIPIEKAFASMKRLNRWQKGEVTLDTLIVPERCFLY